MQQHGRSVNFSQNLVIWLGGSVNFLKWVRKNLTNNEFSPLLKGEQCLSCKKKKSHNHQYKIIIIFNPTLTKAVLKFNSSLYYTVCCRLMNTTEIQKHTKNPYLQRSDRMLNKQQPSHIPKICFGVANFDFALQFKP